MNYEMMKIYNNGRCLLGLGGRGGVVVAVVVAAAVVHPVFRPNDLSFLLGQDFTGYTHFAFLQQRRALVELDGHLPRPQHHPVEGILGSRGSVDVLEVDVGGIVTWVVDLGGVDINILDQVLRNVRLEAIRQGVLVDRDVDIPHP